MNRNWVAWWWDSRFLALLISQLPFLTSSRSSTRSQRGSSYRLIQDPENRALTRNLCGHVHLHYHCCVYFLVWVNFWLSGWPSWGWEVNVKLILTHLKTNWCVVSYSGFLILFLINSDIACYVEWLQNLFEEGILITGIQRKKMRVREGQWLLENSGVDTQILDLSLKPRLCVCPSSVCLSRWGMSSYSVIPRDSVLCL